MQNRFPKTLSLQKIRKTEKHHTDSAHRYTDRRYTDHRYTKAALAALLITGTLLLPTDQTVKADGIEIFINDVPLASDVAPVITDGRTMLPLRACAEALDATVNYTNGVITMSRRDTIITLTLGSKDAVINNTTSQMDVVPLVKDSRTLVPLRFISEAFLCPVQWDGANRAVRITTTSSGQQYVQQEVPTDRSIVSQVTQQINNIRLQKQLETLTTVGELEDMAAAHSRDMAENNFISLTSPTNGNTAKRATARRLPTLSELVAQVDYDTATVSDAVDMWFKDDTARAILLDPTAAYIGIGSRQDTESNTVFLTVEVLPSWAYFLNMPQESTLSTPELSLAGRSIRTTETITIYRLSDANDLMYSERQTHDVTVNKGRFYLNTALWDEGRYAIQVANSIIYINYSK